MKRSLAKYFGHCQGLNLDARTETVVPEYVMDDSELMNVLNEIFSVDPDTGFPRGDIAYFLSKDGNPQVKAWLESNLLSPRAKETGSSIDGLTDDFIAEFARIDGESGLDYAARLKAYFDSAKAEFEKLNVKNE